VSPEADPLRDDVSVLDDRVLEADSQRLRVPGRNRVEEPHVCDLLVRGGRPVLHVDDADGVLPGEAADHPRPQLVAADGVGRVDYRGVGAGGGGDVDVDLARFGHEIPRILTVLDRSSRGVVGRRPGERHRDRRGVGTAVDDSDAWVEHRLDLPPSALRNQ
jgi:hypothetical protein